MAGSGLAAGTLTGRTADRAAGAGCLLPGVFSPYVAQAGSAWPAFARAPAPTAFNRAGEKPPGDWGGAAHGGKAGVVPVDHAGLAPPLASGEGPAAPAAGCGRHGAGQAASARLRPASAGSQLVPCTVME